MKQTQRRPGCPFRRLRSVAGVIFERVVQVSWVESGVRVAEFKKNEQPKMNIKLAPARFQRAY
jgi:hypothetical protein